MKKAKEIIEVIPDDVIERSVPVLVLARGASMSSIQLTQFHSAKLKPSRRLTHCKNCMPFPGQMHDRIPAGARRIVVSGGFGHASKNLTLCPACAGSEAERLEELALEIRRALK